MKFFSRMLSRAGSSSSPTSSISIGRPKERQSSIWVRKNLWFSDVTWKSEHRLIPFFLLPNNLIWVEVAQLYSISLLTWSALAFSFFLIQDFPWVWGSMRRGYLVAFVTIMPFCTDKSSPGSPWRFHSLILNIQRSIHVFHYTNTFSVATNEVKLGLSCSYSGRVHQCRY